MSYTVILDREKETKSTWRYKERQVIPTDQPTIGLVYIPKTTLKKLRNPKSIKITLERE